MYIIITCNKNIQNNHRTLITYNNSPRRIQRVIFLIDEYGYFHKKVFHLTYIKMNQNQFTCAILYLNTKVNI